MTEIVTLPEGKKVEQLSNVALLEKLRPSVPGAIQRLIDLSHSTNDNVALGATKTIIAKFLPDLKSMDLTGELNADGSRPQIGLFINIGGGFIPTNLKSFTPSAGSITGESKAIQSPDLAPESQKDHNSNL